MANLYSRDQVLDAVKEYLQLDGFVISEYAEAHDPARVPIFGERGTGKSGEHVFVDIITEKYLEPDLYFKDRVFKCVGTDDRKIIDACSASFYRHYFPNASVYWAIPDYATTQEGFTLFEKKCCDNNIGIYIVGKEGETFKIIREAGRARSLFCERLFLLREELTELGTTVDDDRLQDILNKLRQGDISYLVFYPEPIYRARDIISRDHTKAISGDLINYSRGLENVSYKEILSNFSRNYYTNSQDAFETALVVTKELWHRYDNIPFPDLHEKFEGILRLDQNYRDHFLHSFQVFLYGTYIIDRMYDQLNHSGFEDKEGFRLEDAWLIASTFHDYTYMIEKFEKWTGKFFSGALHFESEGNPASLKLEESYINEGFMFLTKEIFTSIGLPIEKISLDFIYDRILKRKNHGVLSALALMKYIGTAKKQGQGKCLAHNTVLTAAKAISLHDGGIWEFISGIKKDIPVEDKIGRSFAAKRYIPGISISDDPISFLLNLSDFVQEEGRVGARFEENDAELKTFIQIDGKFHTEISFSGPSSSGAFDYKCRALDDVYLFLKGDNTFEVAIIDANDDKKKPFSRCI